MRSPRPPHPAPARYDVRAYRSRLPGELIVRFARDLLDGIGALDAVGGDAVFARAPVGPPVVLLRHPDLIRALLVDENDGVTKARGLRLARTLLGNGLLTSEVPHHTRQRRLILPAFHHQRLLAYGDTMVRLAERDAAAWTPGAPLDVTDAMMRLTLAIAGETLFGADVLTAAGEVSEAVGMALDAFDRSQFPLADKLTWLPLPARRRAQRARATLDRLVYGLIAERRAEPDGADRDDLLAMLLAARDEASGHGMTDEEVRDEALTLLLAGHETTALGLAWTWHLLAGQPDAARRLHDEAAALDGPPSAADLHRLPFARQVFAESMRLRPPAWAFGREAARDLSLDGVHVPRGATLLVSSLFLHQDPRFWADPGRFDPDRFLPEARSDRHKFAYLPFSAGRRGCIGEQFAWMEGTLVLAALARHWRFESVGAAPGLRGSVTLHPREPIVLRALRY
jgi:cytochrome P450